MAEPSGVQVVWQVSCLPLADLPESDALEGRPVAPRTPQVPVVPDGMARWGVAVMSGARCTWSQAARA